MKNSISMSPNPVVQYLNKPAEELTKDDLIRFIEDYDIQMINFRYAGWDGRLKTLNFIIGGREHLDNILTAGERVDGSSLFPFVEAGSSDLYVIPRYKTAFLDPFSEIPTLNLLCTYYDRDGKPYESAPEHILKKAHQALSMLPALRLRQWESWNIILLVKMTDCLKPMTKKHITNRLHFQNGVIFVPAP